jgi:hypothetical protein
VSKTGPLGQVIAPWSARIRIGLTLFVAVLFFGA